MKTTFCIEYFGRHWLSKDEQDAGFVGVVEYFSYDKNNAVVYSYLLF